MEEMIRLRPYKQCDAKHILSWCEDEKTFLLWGGNHFGTFPITEDIINYKYFHENGDCIEEDNFYPMTAFDDDGMVGHFIMRYLHGDHRILRFGWVIVDSAKRGQKYGQRMLKTGLKYAFEILQVDKVTIGVFENNVPAFLCYLACGFSKVEPTEPSSEVIQGEEWKIIELEMTRDNYMRRMNADTCTQEKG